MSILLAALLTQNPVDAYFEKWWKENGVEAAPRADDYAFLRRASLDVLGRLPTPDEIRAFAKAPEREKKIDELLAHPDAAEFFADTWMRVLLAYKFEETTPLKIHFPAFRAWLKEVWAKDLPYRDFATALLSDHGDNVKKPASNFMLAALDPMEAPHEVSNRVTRVFLGLQIQCARCHDHPFEKWTQEQFWSLTAFFNGLKGKARQTFDGYGVKLGAEPKGMMMIPDSKTEVAPRFLDGRRPDGEEPPLKALARFTTSHPNFLKAAVNRAWGHFMGRGFVEPVDKFTEKSRPSHPELLEALVVDFEKSGTRFRALARRIMTSTAYQAASTRSAEADPVSHAYMHLKPQSPVQVLNTLTYALNMDVFLKQFYQGFLKTFEGDNFFAKSYGNPEVFRMFLHIYAQGLLAPTGVAPEEARYTGSVRLALKLMNGGDLQNLVKAEWGRLAEILKKEASPERRIEEIFLTLLSRPPDALEKARYVEYVARKKGDKKAYEDLYWVLLNSTELIFNH